MFLGKSSNLNKSVMALTVKLHEEVTVQKGVKLTDRVRLSDRRIAKEETRRRKEWNERLRKVRKRKE